MVDTVTAAQRSRNMSRIRSRDTKPEKIVRTLLHRAGFRFRLHVTHLPGKPDVVLPKHQKIVLVHGCFWHRHPGCKRCTTPSTNQGYWIPKLEGNAKRDRHTLRQLNQLGWKTLVIWECETKNPAKMDQKLRKFLSSDAYNQATI